MRIKQRFDMCAGESNRLPSSPSIPSVMEEGQKNEMLGKSGQGSEPALIRVSPNNPESCANPARRRRV